MDSDEKNDAFSQNLLLVVPAQPELSVALESNDLPSLVASAGPGARFAWEEFIYAKIRNKHTRRAYEHSGMCQR